MNRRNFLTAATVAGASALVAPIASAAVPARRDASGNRIKLGIDNFAVRAWGWKGRELVDYAAGLKLDTLFITDLAGLGSSETSAAVELRKYAADKGVEILLGSWSICPTSKSFKKIGALPKNTCLWGCACPRRWDLRPSGWCSVHAMIVGLRVASRRGSPTRSRS